MHEERSESLLEADHRVERNIMLSLLLDSPGQMLWSRAELALELQESHLAVEDALARLRRAGLVLRCGDECVTATRAARRLEELDIIRD